MLRILLILPVLAIFFGILGAGHWYLANRLVVAVGLPDGITRVLLFAIAGGAASIVLQPITERLVRPPWSRVVAWPATLWMGLFFYLFLLTAFSDLLLLVGSFLGEDLARLSAQASVPGLPVARWRSGLVLAIACSLAGAGLRGGLSAPACKQVEIWIERWPAALDGFRIVQISDIHIGPILGQSFARHLVDRIHALAPDLVAITGDLVDGRVGKIAAEVAPFSDLKAPRGVFLVTGNHDHYSGVESWVEWARGIGICVLRNQRVTIEEAGLGSFELAGVDDHRSGFETGRGGEDLDAALEDLSPDRAVILLAHDPTTFKRASAMGIDLQISGHTHGGQIWPFEYFVRAAVPFVAGHYRRGDAQLYVSRGTGFWGPPMRLFAPSEITEIRLRSGVQPASLERSMQ